MFSFLRLTILTASMPKFTRSAIIAASIILPIISSATYAPKAARAESNCQCVEYVKNRFGITVAVGNAKDMIYSLPKLGFTKIDQPQVGAVVVMQDSFPGADPTYGHVGIVERILQNGQIEVRGANQSVGGSMFSESGCSNVRLTKFGTSINGRSDISFWAKTSNTNPQTNPSTESNIHKVNFSAKAAPVQIKVRPDPSTKNPPVSVIEANQPISFDAWTYGEVLPDYWTNQSDARWYRIAGTNNWVASAVVAGNAPGSKPMP
jgi:surface antigen